ncbi:MAG: hypothetical protein BGO98_25855 [Myxococcales bacterium 68-20]|nr:hypothetical protein [Myxococcales bacterium]OJY16072.1 MAG: hypothetical protein BGO98_25855 [Myxococcales bacterium 68-20]
MPFTRRLPDRRPSIPLAILASVATVATIAACSSDGDGDAGAAADGSADAAPEARPEPTSDGGDADASPSDAGVAFDAAPRPVVCTSQPCAKALVTTSTSNGLERDEGYCALLDDGTVVCWGTNRNGQLGRGEDGGTYDSSEPALVVGISEARQLDHTCAVNASGEIWCWGLGPFLRSPTARTLERTPVKLELPPAERVAVSTAAGCAVIDGGVQCWGANYYGQVGPLNLVPPSGMAPARAIELPPGAPIRDLVLGDSTFLLRDDGTVLSWGANPPLARVSSFFPDPNPATIELAGVTFLDSVTEHACAVAGGAGYCWGARLDPKHPVFDRGYPERVVAPEPIVQIATTTPITVTNGGASVLEPPRWCAVGASGDVYCWGSNASGQVGDGTRDYAFDAVKVPGLPAPAVQVRTMPSSTCVLLTNGKIHCWGTNVNGQLGNKKVRGVHPTPQEVVLP